MRDKGFPKVRGCSSIELGGYVQEFVPGKQIHSQMEEI